VLIGFAPVDPVAEARLAARRRRIILVLEAFYAERLAPAREMTPGQPRFKAAM
jgi:hypothetical protein